MKASGIIILTLIWVQGAYCYCPSLCTCKANKAAEGALAEPQPGELLRLKCGGTPAQFTELKEINLTKLWTTVVSL